MIISTLVIALLLLQTFAVPLPQEKEAEDLSDMLSQAFGDENPSALGKPISVITEPLHYVTCAGCKYCFDCETAYLSCRERNCEKCYPLDGSCITKCSKDCARIHQECMNTMCTVEVATEEPMAITTVTMEPIQKDDLFSMLGDMFF